MIGFVALSTILIQSCKKDVIKELPEENEPVFTANGTLNGESFSIVAGENDAFMQGAILEENGVSLYSGTLFNGNYRIDLGVFDSDLDVPNSTIIQNLKDTIHFSHRPTEVLAILSINNFPNKSFIQSIDWFVNDLFVGKNSIAMKEPGKFKVCAKVNFLDGSSNTLCNEMIVGFRKNARFKIQHFLSLNGNLKAWIDAESGTISSIEWFKKGVSIGVGDKLNVVLDESRHEITAKVSFTNGTVRTKSILVDGAHKGFLIDDFSYAEYQNSTDILDNHARIVFWKNGVEYRSDFPGNKNDGYFHLQKMEYYSTDTANKKIYKLSGHVKVQVVNRQSGEVVPLEFDTNFGIELP